MAFVHVLAVRPDLLWFRLPDSSTTLDATFCTALGGNHLKPFIFTAFADQGINTCPRMARRDSTTTTTNLTVSRTSRLIGGSHRQRCALCCAKPAPAELASRSERRTAPRR